MLLVALLVSASAAAGAEPERGFVDVYGGIVRLFESDVPQADFADTAATGGLRVGVWLGPRWGLTLRTWYYETDAKIGDSGPSDLALLGIAVEALARWPLDDRWAVYASLGPMLGVSTLDIEPAGRKEEEDARSVAPGVSAGLGVEARLLAHLRLFAEVHGSAAYPWFRFSDHRLAPRLLNVYGLFGFRVPF